MRFISLLIFAIVTANALVIVDSTLASACIYYGKEFDWGCGSHGNGMKAYACRCGNINWLGTITNCIKSNSKDRGLVEHGFKHVAKRCFERGHFDYSLDDMWRFYENGTNYLRYPTQEDTNSQVFTTLGVNQTEFDWYYSKFKDFTLSVERSQWFGWGLVFYWISIIVLATIHNINKRYLGFQLYNRRFQKYLSIPPLIYSKKTIWGKYIEDFFPDSSQTRLHVLIVLLFVILTMISVGVGYDIKTPHPYLTTRWFMNLDIVSYRVDLMSMSLFPVIYFFGIRNNPFIPLSGLGFPAFNYFHKWCAYVCAILAFIHSIIWTVYAIHEGGYKAWYVDAYWKWGIAAMTFLGLLVFHSAKLFRDFAYEFFIFFHKIINIFFIVVMYYHCVDLGWLGWIWAMAGILCFERVMRIARIWLNGGMQSATFEYCAESVVKMTLRKPKFFHYTSGSYSYIYFVDLRDPWYYPWQSHPFTLLTTPETVEGNLVAYFKAKKGITRHLLNKLFSSERGTIRHKILIEGPYGQTPAPIQINQKIVGIAAGLGVTAVYSFIPETMQEKKESAAKNKLIWIIKNINYLSWFSTELKWLQSNGCDVTIIYVARQVEENSSDYGEKKIGNEKIYIRNVNERPNIECLISEEVSVASKACIDVTFVACGPSSFNHEIRTSISREIYKELPININYEEESFTW